MNKLHSSPAAICLQTMQWRWRAGGRQRHASQSRDSLPVLSQWPDNGAPHSNSLNQPLLVADLRSLHSGALCTVGEIIWFETAWQCLRRNLKLTKSGIFIFLLPPRSDKWSCKDIQNCCWFLNKFDQEHLTKSENYLLLREQLETHIRSHLLHICHVLGIWVIIWHGYPIWKKFWHHIP